MTLHIGMQSVEPNKPDMLSDDEWRAVPSKIAGMASRASRSALATPATAASVVAWRARNSRSVNRRSDASLGRFLWSLNLRAPPHQPHEQPQERPDTGHAHNTRTRAHAGSVNNTSHRVKHFTPTFTPTKTPHLNLPQFSVTRPGIDRISSILQDAGDFVLDCSCMLLRERAES